MRRSLALLEHAVGTALRRRGRSVSVALALALTTALFASTFFLTESLRAVSAALAGAAPTLVVTRTVAGRPAPIERAAADAVAARLGVRRVEPRVWGYLWLPALEGNVTVLGLEPATARAVGVDPRLHAVSDGHARVGPGVARALGLRAGDRVAFGVAPLPSAPPPADPVRLLVVDEVLPDALALLASDVVLTSPADARAILGLPEDVVTDLAVDVFPPEERDVVAAAIPGLVAGARVLERDATARLQALTFDGRAGLLGAALLPVLAAFLLLAWERLSGLSRDEQREIGVLKAIGFETRDVLAVRAFEAALVALAGATLGVALGYVHVFVLGAPGLEGALLGWSNLRTPLALPPTVTLDVLAAIVSAVVVPFVTLSIVPAWRAAMLDPDRAMRAEGP